MQEKLLKIRNYFNKEREMVINGEIQRTLIEYLEKEAETYIGKPANSLLDGYVLCLRAIRRIPELVERERK